MLCHISVRPNSLVVLRILITPTERPGCNCIVPFSMLGYLMRREVVDVYRDTGWTLNLVWCGNSSCFVHEANSETVPNAYT